VRRRTQAVDSDVQLSYLEDGDGPAIVCLPGWSQAAVQYAAFIEHFAPRHRVVAVDHRGHGASSDPGFGYHLHRLAADLEALLAALGLERATFVGHSMGVAVLWAYLDVFGDRRVDRLVFNDSRPALLRDPHWTPADAAACGGTMDATAMFDLCAALRDTDGWKTHVGVMRRMVSAGLPEARFEALLETNRATTNETRASLWRDQCGVDWRDVIRRVRRPTLVVHGLASMIPTASQQWVAEAIPGARLATIPAEDGGSHFAFWENPPAFHAIVAAFLGEADRSSS
jgi:pimeloyl-ACP methyl ester carboxylesterase